MGNWFGNLDLAFKYAIVFGALLGLTLVAGLIKMLYNRRRLKKLISKEGDPGARSDEEELNMREKDEGDLFGIRAIEAGFFGGVAQSRPTSVVNSPAATPRGGNTPRSGSPAPSNRNSIVGSKLLNNASSSRGFSGSSTTLGVASHGQRQASVDVIEPAPRTVTPSGLRQATTFSDNGEGRSTTRKSPPSPVKVNSTARLQPSNAELNGRINHSGAVNMALEVPPSPVRLSPTQAHNQFGPPSPTDAHGRDASNAASRELTSSSRFSRRYSGMNRYTPEPPQLTLPQDLGKTAFYVDEQNAHARDKSARASIVSSASRSNGHSGEYPAPSLPNLPIYPPKAATDTRHHRNFSRNERAASPLPTPTAEASDPLMGSDARRSSGAVPESQDAGLAYHGMDETQDDSGNSHSLYANSEPRTSFSFARTDDEYKGGAHRPPRATKRLGEDIPMSSLKPRKLYSNQAAGHYAPAKPDGRLRENVSSPGGKGGDFF